MPDPLCLLTVHAHPDDESSKGAGTVARYHQAGVRTVLVCCTGGEEGEILNPALDTPDVQADIPARRRQELAEATAIIGYDEVDMLGYRDSGMPDSQANAHPDSFAQAPLDQAVGRLVAVIRRTRPQVMVVYDEEQSGYPHPDHLRVHEIGVVAFAAAGDPDRFPEAGEPYQPQKLYYTGFSARRFRAIHEKFLELGLDSPFDEEWQKRWEGIPESPVTTTVDISGFGDVRRRALLAHATQVDPESPFWFGLPPEVMDGVQPVDEYRLARVATTDGGRPVVTTVDAAAMGNTEVDLFAGVTDAVASPAR
ncbi:MAG: mycothiol conjugate amidase Mca [Acidimicrobiales bacterium]